MTIADIKAEYAAHLPHPSSFESTVVTWKLHVAESTDIGTDLLSTCNFADDNKVSYPNIHAILLLLSLPVLARVNDRLAVAIPGFCQWGYSHAKNSRSRPLPMVTPTIPGHTYCF